ncbi:MAG: nucleoside monophosphate kinase [bacterium]|nr:nucleoside monophosphate kinase [bacterium]
MKVASLLFGGPGAGKGNASGPLKGLGYQLIGTGDYFRMLVEQARVGDEEAGRIATIMSAGKRVPDESVMAYVSSRLEVIDLDCSLIFDAPRSPGQVRQFKEMMMARGVRNVLTFYLDAPEHLCRERLRKRAQQEDRNDNGDEVIERRLHEYREYGPETLEALYEHTDVLPINATMPRLHVQALILHRLTQIEPNQTYEHQLMEMVRPKMHMAAAG